MKLFSINRLAGLLEKDRQTVKRALRGVKPDGKERGQDRWKMATAVRAIDDHQGKTTGRSSNYRLEALIDEEGENWTTIQDHFAQLRAVKGFVERGELVQKLKTGLFIQERGEILRKLNAFDENLEKVLQLATDEMQRQLFAEYMDIMGLERAFDSGGPFIRMKATEIADEKTRKKWGHIA